MYGEKRVVFHYQCHNRLELMFQPDALVFFRAKICRNCMVPNGRYVHQIFDKSGLETSKRSEATTDHDVHGRGRHVMQRHKSIHCFTDVNRLVQLCNRNIQCWRQDILVSWTVMDTYSCQHLGVL